VLDERPDTKSLAFQTFLYSGEEYKGMVDRKHLDTTDIKTLYEYNGLDALFTSRVHTAHMNQMKGSKLISANDLLVRGNQALAELSHNGIKIDKEAYFSYKKKMETEFDSQFIKLKQSWVAKEFEKQQHRELDIQSNKELRILFFDMYGLKPISSTEKGTPQVDDTFLTGNIDDPDFGEFCSDLLNYRSTTKIISNYIHAIEQYADKNFVIHPIYNLWIPRTYRSSCDSPNLQNVPKRDEKQADFRKIFIPRFDYLLDADHKGSEVVIQAMLSNDKLLKKQLKEGLDPHRYWASKIYNIPESKVDKKQRYKAKNGFVFPNLYGAGVQTIADGLGISYNRAKELKDEFFSAHSGIQKYQQGKMNEYEEKGYVSTPLGFIRHAPLTFNQIVNMPIQATSFHYLLDTLIEVVERLKCYKFRSKPVLQIHDDIVLDCVEDEIDEIIEMIDDASQSKKWDFAQDLHINVDYSYGKNWMEMEGLK
jgi:DNA polymerase-1